MTASVGAIGATKQPRFHIEYGSDVESEVAALVELMAAHPALGTLPPRWLAVKLLEDEADIVTRIGAAEEGGAILARAALARAAIEQARGDSADIAIADARYGYVHGVAAEVMKRSTLRRETLTDRIDSVLTGRWVGLPIFLAVMYAVFGLVVNVSAFFLDWVDGVVGGPVTRWASGFLAMLSAPDWFTSLVVDGVIAGVGAVLVFVPGLIVLYLFLTLLEDSGYMARVAFVMDRAMRFTGLHGRSFMPMILGFGCAVPAIYATRTLEGRNQRVLTSLVLPLMSCSARLPVYVVFGLAFFGAAAGNVITGLYAFGVVLAAVVASILSRTILKDREDTVFALELPPYRLPMPRMLWRHAWQRTREFVVKAGTVILAVVVVLWFAMSLPWGVEDQRDSYFGQASAAIAPIFEPAGFGGWEATGSLVTGFIAKEAVVSTMGQIYVGGEADEADEAAEGSVPSVAEDVREIAAGLVEATAGALRATISLIPGIDLVPAAEAAPEDTELRAALQAAFSPLAALGFVLFVLVYTPCVATLSALRQELGWRWAAVSGAYQLALAWLLAVIVFQVGSFLGYG